MEYYSLTKPTIPAEFAVEATLVTLDATMFLTLLRLMTFAVFVVVLEPLAFLDVITLLTLPRLMMLVAFAVVLETVMVATELLTLERNTIPAEFVLEITPLARVVTTCKLQFRNVIDGM